MKLDFSKLTHFKPTKHQWMIGGSVAVAAVGVFIYVKRKQAAEADSEDDGLFVPIYNQSAGSSGNGQLLDDGSNNGGLAVPAPDPATGSGTDTTGTAPVTSPTGTGIDTTGSSTPVVQTTSSKVSAPAPSNPFGYNPATGHEASKGGHG